MEDLARELKDWQFFFATVATASATLTGLLFVSLSLLRQGNKADLAQQPLQAARRSFGDFLYVLMLALVFLVPHRSPGGLAIALFVLGASRGIGLIRQAARTRPRGGKRLSILGTLREVALPAVASRGAAGGRAGSGAGRVRIPLRPGSGHCRASHYGQLACLDALGGAADLTGQAGSGVRLGSLARPEQACEAI